MNTLFLNEHRCKCGKLLLKGVFFDGTAEVKCKNCGSINKIGRLKLNNDDTHYLLIINNKGEIINASRSACRILGYSCEELIGKHFTKINPTLPKEFGTKTFGPESVLSEDNYFQLSTNHKTKDGKIISVIALLKLYKPNDKEKYVLLSAEVKDGKKADKNLARNKLDFIEEACDFYFEIDKNGSGTHIGPSIKEIFGITEEEAIGKNYFSFLPVEIRESAQKAFKHFSSRAEPFRRSNSMIVNSNNKTLYYDVYFSPNFNKVGKFIGYKVMGWLKTILLLITVCYNFT